MRLVALKFMMPEVKIRIRVAVHLGSVSNILAELWSEIMGRNRTKHAGYHN